MVQILNVERGAGQLFEKIKGEGDMKSYDYRNALLTYFKKLLRDEWENG